MSSNDNFATTVRPATTAVVPDEARVAAVRGIIETEFRARNRKLYHPIAVPGLEVDGLIVDSSGFDAKWQAISSRIEADFGPDLTDRRILDIGANSGFFSISLARRGASVVAYERDEGHSKLARAAIACHNNLALEWRNRSFQRQEISGERFDAALMLSVFQWMADGGRRLAEATAELRAISDVSDSLYFEMGYNEGASCLHTDARDHLAYLTDFLRSNTRYRQITLLRETELYRYRGISRLIRFGRRRQRYLVLCKP